MITRHDVQVAEYIIDESGVVDILLEGRRRSKRGRKAKPQNYRLFLIGGFLTVSHHGNFVIDAVHQTLTRGIPLPEQFRLGIREWVEDRDGEPTVRILSIDDLYYVSKRLGNDLAYGQGSAPDLDGNERTRRHQVIRDYCDALMDVFDLGFDTTAQAVDATGIWSWGKGRWKQKTANAAAGDSGNDRAKDSNDAH